MEKIEDELQRVVLILGNETQKYDLKISITKVNIKEKGKRPLKSKLGFFFAEILINFVYNIYLAHNIKQNYYFINL